MTASATASPTTNGSAEASTGGAAAYQDDSFGVAVVGVIVALAAAVGI